jgi:hypothetical protein
VLKSLIGSAVLAFALGLAPAAAQPALWAVSDKDSTVYLFGTVHLLDPSISWRDARLDEALAKSSEIWFELDLEQAQNPANIQPLQSLLIDPAKPLSKRLTPEQHQRFVDAATKLGLPAQQLDALRPWFAALNLALTSLTKAGAATTSGVDQILFKERVGKELSTFETLEQQFRVFADLPADVEVEYLMQTIDSLDEGPAYFQSIVDAWAKGDQKALNTLLIAPALTETPEVYAVLFKNRNIAWAERLDEEMKGAGVDFVAVGAGHLVGKDSVQELLRAKGYKVKRVN